MGAPPTPIVSMRSTKAIGIMLKSTARPPPETSDETKRRPLTTVNVRCVPKSKKSTKFAPILAPCPPFGSMPPPKAGISVKASAMFVNALFSSCSAPITVVGKTVSRSGRRMREPVTTTVSLSSKNSSSVGT